VIKQPVLFKVWCVKCDTYIPVVAVEKRLLKLTWSYCANVTVICIDTEHKHITREVIDVDRL
jgi:hypothetical protein